MNEQESIAYIEEWDVTEAAKVLKWYEDDKLLRPCDCDAIVAIETEDLKAENDKLRELAKAAWGCVNRHVSCDACRVTCGCCTLQSATRELGIEVE